MKKGNLADSKSEYYLMDVLKLIFAVLILGGHYTSNIQTPFLVKSFFSLSALAVPFYFACTGYLIGKQKTNTNDGTFQQATNAQIKRIILMYFSWSIIYVLLQTIAFLVNESSTSDIIFYVHKCIVYSTYQTIWFLPATAIGLFLLRISVEKLGERVTAIIAGILYVICMMGFSYSFVIKNFPALNLGFEIYNKIFISVRNGVFYGFPFVFMGWRIGKIDNIERWIKQKDKLIFLLTGISVGAFVIEALLLKKFGNQNGSETLVLHLLTTPFLLLTAISIKGTRSRILFYVRKMSTLIFVSQRVFLTAFPAIIPALERFYIQNPWYYGLCFLYFATILISNMIFFLSKRYRFATKLM